MSVAMSLLAILDEGPGYGLQLKNEFEARTASVWPLNVGQVYTTLARLERDGFVRSRPDDGEKTYDITPAGRARLDAWFAEPSQSSVRSRDELVLKLVMSLTRAGVDPQDVIQAQRKAAVSEMQDYTRLKRDAGVDGDVGWLFLLDSLIFQAEARVRWLDACEARLRRPRQKARAPKASDAEEREEVRG